MSQACEDFLRGHGRLAGLLWELKPYEPPASLEARFLAAARAAQANADAAGVRSRPTSTSAQPAFEAPADMAARFSQLAAQVDAAQAARREAVLGQIAAGDTPQAVLGAPIQPETAAWLKNKAAGMKSAKPPRKPVLWGYSWFDLRLAALATILAAVGTQWLLQFTPSPVETALLEAFRNESQPLADAQPDPPQNPHTPAASIPPRIADSRVSDTATRTPASEQNFADTGKVAPGGQSSVLEHGSTTVAEETPVLAISAQPAPVATELKRERGQHDAVTEVAASSPATKKTLVSRADEALLATPERTTPAAAKAPAPAAAPAPMPAPAAQPAPARPATLTVPASPAAETLPRPVATTRGFAARISEDPASFASILPVRPAGLVWRVISRVEDEATARSWLEALRQSMPVENRPARFELIHEAGSDESGWLRIIPPPAEGLRIIPLPAEGRTR